jgi:outer membrane receptor for ferrienterochelin and colicin
MSFRACALAALFFWSQPITITGTTVDGVSGRPISGAQVKIGARELRSDADGRFHFEIAAGQWEIQVSAPNYTSRKIAFDAASSIAPLVIQLIPENVFNERLEVTAAVPAERLDEPAAIPLAPQQVLSTAGSLDNPFRTLATLPGVTATDEIGSKLSIRGGAPDQNLTIMDGVEMHNPYRLFGITSAFNPETVSRFEMLGGGFSAKYGDRLSSVIVVENRDGNASERVSGSSSLSITDANVILEGRLPGPGKGTWLATTRRTYYDLVAERVIDQDLPSFDDMQIKTAWQLPGGRRLSLLGLRSRETTDITPEADADDEGSAKILSRNDLAAATLVSPIGRASSTSIVSFSRNTDLIDVREDEESAGSDEPEQFNRELSIDDVSLREELRLPTGGRHQLEAGTEWHQLRTHVSFTTFDDRDPFGFFRFGSFWLGGVFPDHVDDTRRTWRGGAWLEDRITLGPKVTVSPGIRWDWSGLTSHASVSPRLSAVVALNSATRLTAAGGLFTQSPGYEKVLQADHFTDLTGSDQLDLRPERATHMIVGVDRDLGGLQARVETYYKGFSDLITGRLETEDERLDRVARYNFPATLASSVPTAALITAVPTNDSKGRAYGLDMFLTRPDNASHPRLTGWLSYSLAHTEQDIYGRRVPFSYDRGHAFSAVWNWRATSRWTISGTARVASGFPYTPPSGIRVASRELRSRLVPATPGPGRFELEVAPGGVADLNSRRMPMFGRMDLRFAYRPRGAKGRWEIYLEILNALNRRNAILVDANIVDGGTRLEEKPIGGFPALPTFGVRFRF